MYNPYKEITAQVQNLSIDAPTISNQNNAQYPSYNYTQNAYLQANQTGMKQGNNTEIPQVNKYGIQQGNQPGIQQEDQRTQQVLMSEYQLGYQQGSSNTSQYYQQLPPGINQQSSRYSEVKKEEQFQINQYPGTNISSVQTQQQFYNNAQMYRTTQMLDEHSRNANVVPPNSISSHQNIQQYQSDQFTQKTSMSEQYLQPGYQRLTQLQPENNNWHNNETGYSKIHSDYHPVPTGNNQAERNTQSQSLDSHSNFHQSQSASQTQYPTDQVALSYLQRYDQPQTQKENQREGEMPRMPHMHFQREQRQFNDFQQPSYASQASHGYTTAKQTGNQVLYGYGNTISNAATQDCIPTANNSTLDNHTVHQYQNSSNLQRYPSEQKQQLPTRMINYSRDNETGTGRNDPRISYESADFQLNKINDYSASDSTGYVSFNQPRNLAHPARDIQHNQPQMIYSTQESYAPIKNPKGTTSFKQSTAQSQQTLDKGAQNYGKNIHETAPTSVFQSQARQANNPPRAEQTYLQEPARNYITSQQNINYCNDTSKESQGYNARTDGGAIQYKPLQNPANNTSVPLARQQPESGTAPAYPTIYAQQQQAGNSSYYKAEAVSTASSYGIDNQRRQNQNMQFLGKNVPHNNKPNQVNNDGARNQLQQNNEQQNMEHLPQYQINSGVYRQRLGSFDVQQNSPDGPSLTRSLSQDSTRTKEITHYPIQKQFSEENNFGRFPPQGAQLQSQGTIIHNKLVSSNSNQPTYSNPVNTNQQRHPVPYQPGLPAVNFKQPGHPVSNASQFRYPVKNDNQVGQPVANAGQSGQPLANSTYTRYPMENTSQTRLPTANATQYGYSTANAFQAGQPMTSTSQSGHPMVNVNQSGYPMRNSGEPGQPMSNAGQPGRPMESATHHGQPKANASQIGYSVGHPNQFGHPMIQQTGQPIVIMPGLSNTSRPIYSNFEPKLQIILENIVNRPGPSFVKLRKIAEDVLAIQNEAINFNGRRGDRNYIVIEEMLTRQLLALDAISTDGMEDVRLTRKSMVRQIQGLIYVLEQRAKT